jgi:hypothetical protein
MANVTITYNGSFTFNPTSVSMDAPGAVNLNKAANSTWSFADFAWCGTTQPNAGTFNVNVNSNNIVLTDNIRDGNGNINNGTFSYKVGITLQGSTNVIWSPDPDVDNDAPGMIAHKVAAEAKAY